MLLRDLLKDMEIVNYKGSLDIEVSSIAYDSRKAKKDTLFVCIEGNKADGHRFIADCIENGARAFLVQKDVDVPEGISVVKVNDTRYGLAHVADLFYGHPSGKASLIGVTGTKGKTTTTYMMKAILEAAKQKVGLIGTVEKLIGDEVLYAPRTTPESLDLQSMFAEMIDKNVNSIVMEVSSQGLALHRVSRCVYDIGVFTNLSRDHIGPGEHENMEEYLNAKIKLFSMCKTGLINIDSEYGEQVIKNAKCKIYTYGIDKEADIKAENVIKHSDSVEFKAVTPWGDIDVKVNLPGKFSIYNALAAIGTCGLMGIKPEVIKEGLENVSVPGRVEVVETGKDFTIIIDYAHTPDSLENVLTTIKAYAKGRVISLFGCGGDRDRAKRPMMGEISGRIADFTIITSDNPRTEEPVNIVNEIETGIKAVTEAYITIVDRKEAIEYAIAHAQTNDIIVLAGKGHETYQEFANKTIHFDEREVVKEILSKNA